MTSDKRQEVSDLRDDGSIFCNEKALMLLYSPEKDAQNENDTLSEYAIFDNCSLAGCTNSSKDIVIQRIKAIQNNGKHPRFVESVIRALRFMVKFTNI